MPIPHRHRDCNYAGNSPAMLAALDAISARGIAEARQMHFRRLAEVREFAANPALYFAAIHPALTTNEAIEDAKRYARRFFAMPSWHQASRRHDLVEANKTILYARFFRRYGARVWAREAALQHNLRSSEKGKTQMHIHDYDPSKGGAMQGDLCIWPLSPKEAAKLAGIVIKAPQRGSIRLLEGEVTGHHHEIVMDHDDDFDGDAQNAEAIAAAALAIAKARSAAERGTATLYQDDSLASSLPWLQRRDLMIGFLHVEGGPVILRHPEHDAIRLPKGTYYVGRQVESAGAEERVVAD